MFTYGGLRVWDGLVVPTPGKRLLKDPAEVSTVAAIA